MELARALAADAAAYGGDVEAAAAGSAHRGVPVAWLKEFTDK